jgi:outer membrane protein
MVRKIFLYVTFALILSASLTWAAKNPATTIQSTLTLEKCLELAYANNQQLKATTQAVVIAQATVDKAKGGFLPSLDYQLGMTNSNDPDTGLMLLPNSSGGPEVVSYEYPNPAYSGSLSASYPLYTGGKLQNALKIARLQLDLAKEKERAARQKLTYNVKATYHQVWLAEEQLLVANASYENMARHAERIEKLFAVGNTSKFELLRAQVNRDNLKPNVIKAQNGVALAKLALQTLIGLKQETPVKLALEPDSYQLPEKPNYRPDTALTAAYQNRSELKQLQISARIMQVQTDLAEAHLKPDVSLTGSYQRYGDDLSLDSSKEWTLTFEVKGNLFNGTNKPEISIARAQLKQQKIEEDGLKDSIRQEVEEVLNTIKENRETIKSTQASIILAKEALRLTEVRFQAGMATTMDVMDAQLALDQALTGYYNSLSAYLTAIAKWDLVTGVN